MRYSERHSDPEPEDDDGGPWGVYDCNCAQCGKRVVVVATMEGFEGGDTDWQRDPRCTDCQRLSRISLN